jgi:hypothetical protein
MESVRIGVVLSAGGLRGAAHAGVLSSWCGIRCPCMIVGVAPAPL